MGPGAALLDRLTPEARSLLERAAGAASERGFRLYLVGGIVRDLLLERPNLDLDVVVEGDAAALGRALGDAQGARVTVHERFRTASITVQGLRLDLATARTEGYPRPGALPVVSPGTLQDDLSRRDFTINAMALSLNAQDRGRLIDPLGGLRDLRAGQVRVLHDRSFQDDATRLLRAVRYEQRFRFALEASTEALVRRDASMLSTISADRLRHEVQRTLQEERAESALTRAHNLGILEAVHPALAWDGWLAERFNRARGAGAASPAVLMALMVYRLQERDAHGVAERLRFPGSWARVSEETRRLATSLPMLETPDVRPSVVYAALRSYSVDAVRACRLAIDSAIIRDRLDLYLEKLRSVRPLLDGRALVGLGVPEGPRIGELLEMLRNARLDGQVASKAEEIALVQRWSTVRPKGHKP